MEEKVLIQSKQYNVKKLFKLLLIIGAVLSVLLLIASVSSDLKQYKKAQETYEEHYERGYCWYFSSKSERCYDCKSVIKNGSTGRYAFTRVFANLVPSLIPLAFFALVGGLIYLWLRSYELTITDKRIYGKVAWGKRVDLPVDSVTATSTISLLKGVSVSTPSGRISFLVIKNANDVYTTMNNLLIERQKEKSAAVPVTPVASTSNSSSGTADELLKYKELLDNGVLTQEEFDTKKKQLLGL